MKFNYRAEGGFWMRAAGIVDRFRPMKNIGSLPA